MSVVALRLAGPLQSWGSGSKFVRRMTDTEPTKSGVIGLIAAAKGLRRTDPLDELSGLRFGVRIDREGQLVRDFQTAQRPIRERDGMVTWKPLPLSHRYYRGDAIYLAVLEGEKAQLEDIYAALRRPVFPLFLGRRSCPPAGPVALPGGVLDHTVESALEALPWLGGTRQRGRCREPFVVLDAVRDANPGEPGAEAVHDQPVSFDPERRTYEWRWMLRYAVRVRRPPGASESGESVEPGAVGSPESVEPVVHDPMSVCRGD